MNSQSQMLILASVCATVAWSVDSPVKEARGLPDAPVSQDSNYADDEMESSSDAIVLAKASLQELKASMAMGDPDVAGVATDQRAEVVRGEAQGNRAEDERAVQGAQVRRATEMARAKARRERILKYATRKADAQIAAMEKENKALFEKAEEREDKAIKASHGAEHRINHDREVVVITMLTGDTIKCPP